MRLVHRILPFALLAGALGACGLNEIGAGGEAGGVFEPESDGRLVDVVVPVARSGRASSTEAAQPRAFRPGGPPLLVYINREGATLTGGSDDASRNRSSIVRGSATIPRFRGSDATWGEIRSCVQDQFARFNVTVTDARPASGPYLMAMVGGNGSELGYGRGIGGVAPLDSTDCSVIDSAVVYIFSENLGNNNGEYNCEVIAHEVGHALSLDHEYLASDPMTYLSYNGLQRFQDVDAACGEYSSRSCACGRPRQNSVKVLLSQVGPASGEPPPPPPPGQAPEVRIDSPAEGAVLPADTTLRIVATATDDVQVSKVELLWRYNGAVFPCPGDRCAVSGSTYTFSLPVGSGERRFQVRATDNQGRTTTTTERVIQLDKGNAPSLSLRVLEPAGGAALRPGQLVRLRVDAKGPSPVRSVTMTWSGPAGSLMDSLRLESGTVWSTDIRVSAAAKAGPREIRVSASDAAGGRASAPPVQIQVVE